MFMTHMHAKGQGQRSVSLKGSGNKQMDTGDCITSRANVDSNDFSICDLWFDLLSEELTQFKEKRQVSKCETASHEYCACRHVKEAHKSTQARIILWFSMDWGWSSHTTINRIHYYYICLTAFFQWQPGKLAPERKTILHFNEARNDGVVVASAGPYANHLYLTPNRSITMPVPHRSVFTGQMPFLPPNQLHQSTEGKQDPKKNQISLIVSINYQFMINNSNIYYDW